jgi:hypothetical protein
MSLNLTQDQILNLFYQLSEKPFHINPVYVRLLKGDVSAAYLLTQLVIWQSDYGPGFYHTDELISEKTGMNTGVILNARKDLIKQGFVQTTRQGIPAKLHYTVDMDVLIVAIAERGGCGLSTYADSAQQATSNQHNKLRRNDITITKENKNNNKINNKKNIVHSDDALLVSFNEFWEVWPDKKNKQTAFAKYKGAVKDVGADALLSSLKAYLAEREIEYRVTGWVKALELPSTWLHGKRYNNPIHDEEYFLSKVKKKVAPKGAVEQYAHYNTQPKMHKTEAETKAELNKSVPAHTETVSQERVTGSVKDLKEVLRNEILKSNMERSNVRNHSGRVVPTVEQRNRDSGQEFITPGCATA